MRLCTNVSVAAAYKRLFSTKVSEQCRTPIARIEWGDEQNRVLAAISQGKSVFITGSAGTGKTFLLAEVIKSLSKLHTPSTVSVTASTGIAACALKGQTLHSFAGIGICSFDDPKRLLDKVSKIKSAVTRWRKVKALVVDEISMISAKLFDHLDYIARKIKGVDKPWGGIQIVVSGDFFQLPPIADDYDEAMYAFDADCWNDSFDLQVELTRVFRQSDAGLARLLEGIRRGESEQHDLEFLEQFCSKTKCDSSVVQIFPLNEDVKRVNEARLKSLKKDLVVYKAVDFGKGHWKWMLNSGIAPKEISLCEGARVMLIKNINTESGLVNGATGTVLRFSHSSAKDLGRICPDQVMPVVQFDAGQCMPVTPEKWEVLDGENVVACRKQVPLILAWAMSIHKCQGMTLERLHTDLSRAFGCGMVYVALSRLRSLEGLHLSSFDRSKIKANQKVSRFYKSLASSEQKKEVMVVGSNKIIDHPSGDTEIIDFAESENAV